MTNTKIQPTRRALIGAAGAAALVGAAAAPAAASRGGRAPGTFREILDRHRVNADHVTVRTMTREYAGWVQWVREGYVMMWDGKRETPIRIKAIESVIRSRG